MSKYICLNPCGCDYCIDQIEFEGKICPNCGSTKTGPAEMKKYMPKELVDKLKQLREEGRLIEACIIDPNNIKRGG